MFNLPKPDFAIRRQLLHRGLGTGLAGLLPAAIAAAQPRQFDKRKIGSKGGAEVPSALISLADCGGKPGAAPATLAGAFDKAFAALAKAGGGTLVVPEGLYDFGAIDEATNIILCRNARDIAISAYGATFKITTTAKVMPHLFYFFNFSNVTIAGASFLDAGFSPWSEWQGMYCVGIQTDILSSGFRMVDCYAERVVGMLAAHNNASTRKLLSGISVQGGIRNAYYGVGANFIRDGVDVDLACHNVRRAFIAYSLKNADIAIRLSSTLAWPGSNGLVALVSGGTQMGNVENVRVSIDVTGECIHSSYVHFYHQGPEQEGHMRDIDATVNLLQVNGAKSLFAFDHESDGILARTFRTWDRISLHGRVVGKFAGKVVSNASISRSPGTVYVDHNLAVLAGGRALTAQFRSRPP